jgi:hypothetical protein
MCVLFLSIEILLLMLGLTLTNNKGNLVRTHDKYFISTESMIHGLGVIVFATFIVNSWQYDLIWALWASFW